MNDSNGSEFYMSYYSEYDYHSQESDDDSSIDYPDASEVYWSDEEEHRYHCGPDEVVIKETYIRIEPKITSKPYLRPKNTTDDCPICLVIMNTSTPQVFCAKGCGNTFHSCCIRKYLTHSGHRAKCPLCRLGTYFIPIKPTNQNTD